MTTPTNAVIVGGGLPGLFSALLISDQYPGLSVHIIEREARLGGLYNSFRDEKAGWFDHGMHLIYESTVEDIDRHIRESMDEHDWISLEGNHKDIAGVFHAGRLHEDSPYIDVRDLPEESRRDCLSDLFLQLSEKAPFAGDCSSARDFFLKRFGQSITDRIIEPILAKLWHADGARLDPMITRVVLMDRVCLFEAAAMNDLMASERIRSRLAFPNQMELPLKYRSVQRGLYPKKFGMYRVIEAIEKKLISRGVKIHLGADVQEITIADGEVRTLRAKTAHGEFVIGDVRLVHWSIPLFGLAAKLGLAAAPAKFEAPLAQAYVYLLLSRAPKMGNLYYFYCFDRGFRTYRATNYSNYCPAARNADGAYPMCVELLFEPGTDLASLNLAEIATQELAAFGVIDSPASVVFARAEVSRAGFPVLTLNNSHMMRELRDRVDAQGIRNLITAGQAPERGIFFLHDILEHSYHALVTFQERT